MRELRYPVSMTALLLSLAIILAGCGSEQQTVTIPEGTMLTVSLNNTLSTKTSEAGKEFTANTLDPVMVNGQTAIPAGATVRGELTEVQQPGNVKGRARLTLDFTELVGPDGNTYALAAEPITIEAESGTRDDLEKIAAGAVAGAIIGGLTDGGKGAAIGAAIGAGAGGVVVVATKGDQLTLQPGQNIKIATSAPVEMPILAQADQ